MASTVNATPFSSICAANKSRISSKARTILSGAFSSSILPLSMRLISNISLISASKCLLDASIFSRNSSVFSGTSLSQCPAGQTSQVSHWARSRFASSI